MERNQLEVLARIVLPSEILSYFSVVGVEQTSTEIHRDIPKIIKLKATTSFRISCLFCIFKHSPQKNGLTAQTGVINNKNTW